VQARFATGWLQHTALFGVDYQHTIFNQNLAQGAAPSINIFDPTYYQPVTFPTDNPDTLVTNSHQVSSQTGIYGQDQVKLGNLIVVVGGRHDWAGNDTLTYTDAFGSPTNTDTQQRDQANTGRIGGVYLFDNGIAPYAVYATSFNPNVGTEFSGLPFQPTTGQLYEGGARYQPIGWNAMLTAAVYNLTEQDVLTPDPANPGFDVQTGAIRARGFEFEGKASVTKQFDLIATYTYTDAKVTQSNDVDLGKVPIGIAANMASLWGDYTFRQGALDGFGFGVGVRYIGDSWGDLANSERIPGYTLVDAMLRYDFSHLGSQWRGYEFQLNATNLFDTVYVSECNDTNCVYGLRRKILATLRYRW
jgi:iron complex outermembrane recepter protein